MIAPQNVILVVLLVDDNDNDVELFSFQLAVALPGCKVMIARTEPQVYQLMADAVMDLVVLDLNLGAGTGGVEMVRKVRSLTDAPIIILTGDSNIETAKLAIESGADAYFLKDHQSPDKLRLAVTIALATRDKFWLVLKSESESALIENRARMDEEIQMTTQHITAIRSNQERIRKVLGFVTNGNS